MKTWKNRKRRRGGNAATQSLRRIGLWSYDSTKQAAIDIAKEYDNLGVLSDPDERLHNGEFKGKIRDILRRNFGTVHFRQNIARELRNIDPKPKNIYLAIQDVLDLTDFSTERR